MHGFAKIGFISMILFIIYIVYIIIIIFKYFVKCIKLFKFHSWKNRFQILCKFNQKSRIQNYDLYNQFSLVFK